MIGERKPAVWAWTALFALAFGAVAAACGGGGGTPAPSTQPVETAAAPAPPSQTAAPQGRGLARAQALLEEGNYAAAEEAFESVAAREGAGAVRPAALFGLARAALGRGETDDGIAALTRVVGETAGGADVAVQARYLLVKLLNDSGDYEAALGFASGAVAGGPLAPYAEHERLRALAGLGRRAEAEAGWAALLADNALSRPLRVTVLEARADSSRAGEDAAALARDLDALIALDGRPAARFERATLARAAGDDATFGEQLREVIATSPASPYALAAVLELGLAGLAADPGDVGLVYYRHGELTRARDLLAAAVGEPGLAAEDFAYRSFYLGASREDLGEAAEAVAAYDAAATSGAASPFVHRARYWAARVTEEDGDALAASDRYVALVRDGPAGEFTAEAAFRAGFVLFEAGDPAGSLLAWAPGQVSGGARVAYWNGRAHEALGDSEGAAVAYREAIAAGPRDFYGIEAAARLDPAAGVVQGMQLELTVDWEAIGDWLAGRVPGDWPGMGAGAGCHLAEAGLRGPARAEFIAAAEGATAWRMLEVAREASGCGMVDVAAGMAVAVREAAGATWDEAPRDLMRVAYPLAWRDAFVRAAASSGVDPALLAGMVRVESFWDPGAGSGVGALGLTQVIPPTGEAIARSLGRAEFTAEDLFLPAVSLEFGAHYLGQQLDAFEAPEVALAAYNAGPVNARRWTAGQGGPADFLERVDFQETHRYVALVLEAAAHYAMAWDG